MERVDSATRADIGLLSLDPTAGEARPLLDRPFTETQPRLSPEGGYIAYESHDLGYPEIVVRPFADLDGGWLVSTLDLGSFAGYSGSNPAEARSPVWSPDGSALYYLSGPSLVRVPILGTSPFEAGAPQELVRLPAVPAATGPQYDVAPDGERLVYIRIGGFGGARDPLVMIQNWAEALGESRGSAAGG